MKRIIIILAFLVCGISSAQQYFFNGTVYVPKTTVQINAIVSPPEGRVEANSDTGSLWYFDGAIWKDTFVGVSSFADLEGDPYDNVPLSDALNSKAADSVVVKTSLDSQIQNLKLAVGDSAWIASKTFGANDIVINTDENPPGGDEFVTDGNLSGAGVLTLNRNYGSPIQISGFNSGSGTTGSGTTGITLIGSTSGTHTFTSTNWTWYQIGKIVNFRISLSGIQGNSVGVLTLDYNSTTIPNMTDSSIAFNVFYQGITAMSSEKQNIQARYNSPRKLIFDGSMTYTSNTADIGDVAFTDGILLISGTYTTD